MAFALAIGIAPIAPITPERATALPLPPDGTVEYLQVVPASHEEVLGSPQGVAYNGLIQHMLVTDALRKEILVYDATMSLIATFSAGPDGDFLAPGDVSDTAFIDRARKSVYRIDGGMTPSTIATDPAWGDPQGIEFSGLGLWVVDRHYGLVHVYNSSTGEKIRTLTADNSMNWPTDVHVWGNPFVTDKNNQRVLDLDSITGDIVRAWDTSTLGPGNWYPTYLTGDGYQRLWVLDDTGSRIHRIDRTVATDSPSAYIDTLGSAGAGWEQLRGATGITNSLLGILVADTANGRVKVINSDSGATDFILGGGAGALDGQFWMPGDVEIDSAGNVYVADVMNDRVQKLDAAGDHVATYGPIVQPSGIGVATDGTLWIAEKTADKIWRVTAGGSMTSYGGTGSGLGQFSAPEDVAVAPDGTVIVSDTGNGRFQRLSAEGVALEEWAAIGAPGAIDTLPDGGLVYRDNTAGRVRRLRSDHVETGNFSASFTRFDVDDAGNIYAPGSDGMVRMYDCYGTELLSWGEPGFSAGQFQEPSGVAVGAAGTVWVADSRLHRLQRFTVHDHTPPESGTSTTDAWSPDDVEFYVSGTDTPGRIARFYTSLNGTATVVSYPDRITGWRASRTISDEGTTVVGYFAEDAFGNVEETKTAMVRIDRTSPTVDLVGEPADWVSSDVTLTIDGFDAHSGIKDYFVGGATLVGDTAVVTGEGTTTVTAWARDNVDRASSVTSATVRIDKSDPFGYAQLLAEAGSNPMPVLVNGYDAISGIDQVYYQVDGGAPQLGPATLELAVSGEHTITVWAADKAGNTSSPQDFGLSVGSGGGEDPLAGDFVVDGGRQWTNKYEAPVESSITGAEQMRFQVAAGGWSEWLAYSQDATVTLPIEEGQYAVEAEYKDAAEQVTSRSANIGVDRTPGTCTSNIDRTTYRTAETFIFVADDGRSGPGDCYSSIDGGAAVLGDELAVSKPGTHTIEFWALDLAGNESDHTTRDVFFTHPVTLEATAAPTPVVSRSPLEVTISMRDEDGAPVVGKQVIVHYSTDGGSTWLDVPGTFAADNGDGTYTIGHAPSQDVLYRARFFEDEWYNAADSAPVAVDVIERTPTTTTATASTSLVSYGGGVTIYGVPKTESGSVIGSGVVKLWTKPYGSSTWTQKATATWDAANQRYAATTSLTIGTYMQVRFEGDAANAPSNSSGTLFVRARPKVGNPVAPSSSYRGRRFTVYGSLYPSHAKGTAVRIYKQRYVSGTWRSYSYVTAKTVSSNKYSLSMSLPYSGRWRLRAYHSDSGHYGTYSTGYDYITIK